MSTFAVGDVCEIINCQTVPVLNGLECTVIGTRGGDYLIDVKHSSIPPNCTVSADPVCLRKRKPPDDQKKRETDKPEMGEWELCPWKPRKVTLQDQLTKIGEAFNDFKRLNTP